MPTLTHLCPNCHTPNKIVIEVDKPAIPCTQCGTDLGQATPLSLSDELCKRYITDSDLPLLIDFYSPDCAPCMEMAPDFSKASEQFALEVGFIKVNTTQHQNVAREYGVNQLPTIIAFKNGREVNRFSAKLSLDQLTMWAESLIQMQL